MEKNMKQTSDPQKFAENGITIATPRLFTDLKPVTFKSLPLRTICCINMPFFLYFSNSLIHFWGM